VIFISPILNRLRVLRNLAERGANPVAFLKYVPSRKPGCDLELRLAERGPGDPFPAPPASLRLGYGSDDASYVESGRQDVIAMMDAVKKALPGWSPGSLPILDLGCGAGRMLRHLHPLAAGTEVWGLDISAPHIGWLKTHLSPPFLAAVNTTLPHLPFPDGRFGLVYCGSVFTHIDDLAESWFLEVRRVLGRGGVFYCTVHDEHTLGALRTETGHPLAPLAARQPSLSSDSPADIVVVGSDSDANVFYSGRYLRGFLGRLFNVLAVVPGAYGYQTAWILQGR
jgi:SAM-dependent methyltransferase